MAILLSGGAAVQGQPARLLGLDISAHQGIISQDTWNAFHDVEHRDFALIRSSRGGTTGQDRRQGGHPIEDNDLYELSQRYDDPYFVQNITRATAAGIFAGSYHRSRADVLATTPNYGGNGTAGVANNGTDEANHMIQMAGAFMRPGYLMPVLDFEDGELTANGGRPDQEMATFALDFGNRIYEVMGIRPAIYTNGNYAHNVLGGGTPEQRQQLAQQASVQPGLADSPTFPTLWSARWPNQANPNAIDVQNGQPKDSFANIYGPWDDNGVEHPWSFWQYASTGRLQSFKNGTANLDFNVANGGVEFVKDRLVPAVWLDDQDGQWTTLSNWNSGQPAVAPIQSPGQMPPTETGPLPTPRVPGAAGVGVTSGQHDTVILERAGADITVTHSLGTHNVRKLYMRETLNITGGSLTVNYVPSPDSTAYSAVFSGPVTLAGGELNVHTLQVDAEKTFTLSGGSLAFSRIDLTPHAATPAKIRINGPVNVAPLGTGTATIGKGAGAGGAGSIDLAGGVRTITVADLASNIDLSIDVSLANGGMTFNGPGTVELKQPSTVSGGVNVVAGRLLVNNASGSGTGLGDVSVSGAGRLGGTGSIGGTVTVQAGGAISPGMSAGELAVAKAIFLSGSSLDIELGGMTAGTQYDRLDVVGAAKLAGTLNVGLLNGLQPTLGDSFTILTASSLTGQFNTVDAPQLGEGSWQVSYGGGAVTLTVIDSPPLPGDFNADGVVDGADLAKWGPNFGAGPGAERDQGDADGDGRVDGADFLVWQRNVTAAAAAAVPEPAAWALLGLAAAVGATVHRRRWR